MSALTVTVSPTIRLTGNRPASSSGEMHSIVIRRDLRLAMADRAVARTVRSWQLAVGSGQCAVGSWQCAVVITSEARDLIWAPQSGSLASLGMTDSAAGNRANRPRCPRGLDDQFVRDPANGQQVASSRPDHRD